MVFGRHPIDQPGRNRDPQGEAVVPALREESVVVTLPPSETAARTIERHARYQDQVHLVNGYRVTEIDRL